MKPDAEQDKPRRLRDRVVVPLRDGVADGVGDPLARGGETGATRVAAPRRPGAAITASAWSSATARIVVSWPHDQWTPSKAGQAVVPRRDPLRKPRRHSASVVGQERRPARDRRARRSAPAPRRP